MDRVSRRSIPVRMDFSSGVIFIHYLTARQCVLANVRAAGEPTFEHDFPPGTDMVREGPYGQERFEMELAARLHALEA
jgi:hypothetical protein